MESTFVRWKTLKQTINWIKHMDKLRKHHPDKIYDHSPKQIDFYQGNTYYFSTKYNLCMYILCTFNANSTEGLFQWWSINDYFYRLNYEFYTGPKIFLDEILFYFIDFKSIFSSFTEDKFPHPFPSLLPIISRGLNYDK